MTRIVLVAFLISALCSSAFAQGTPAREQLRDQLSEIVSLVSDGYAEGNPGSYSIHTGQILQGPKEDAAVLFVVEGFAGANNYSQYLALFAGIDSMDYGPNPLKEFRLVGLSLIGDRGWRFFDPEATRLGDGFITLTGSAYASSDAMCCPSLSITETFAVVNGQLLER